MIQDTTGDIQQVVHVYTHSRSHTRCCIDKQPVLSCMCVACGFLSLQAVFDSSFLRALWQICTEQAYDQEVYVYASAVLLFYRFLYMHTHIRSFVPASMPRAVILAFFIGVSFLASVVCSAVWKSQSHILVRFEQAMRPGDYYLFIVGVRYLWN